MSEYRESDSSVPNSTDLPPVVVRPSRAAAIAAGSALASTLLLGPVSAASQENDKPQKVQQCTGEWPVPYLPNDADLDNPPAPNWSRRAAIDAGHDLAALLLTNPLIAEQYRSYAYEGKSGPIENRDNFKKIIMAAHLKGDYANFNAHDFANVHHVAWILIGRALASLGNQHPHGDWGDPPVNGTVHFETENQANAHRGNFRRTSRQNEFWYHFVPNKTGYYAVSTMDTGLTAPNLGV